MRDEKTRLSNVLRIDKNALRLRIKKLLRSNSTALFLITVAVIILFYILNNNFLNRDNIRSILSSMSFVGVLTVGMTLLLIGGEVDLSCGAVACISAIIAALLMNSNVPWVAAVILAILFGAMCGLISAVLVSVLGFMHFIATLGLMSVYQGFVLVITGNVLIPITNEGFAVIGATSIWDLVSLPFIIMLVLMIAYSIILSSTNFGRSIYMCGGNRRAARLCGINPKKVSTILYINSGALAAIAGLLNASRMRTASPVVGQTGAVDAITASVLGGVSFLGGSGGMGSCFIGILLLNSFNAGLTVVGFPQYWQIVARGSLLILALSLDFVFTRSRLHAIA